MGLASKLQIKDGRSVRVVNAPPSCDLGDVPVAADGEAVLVFVKDSKELERFGVLAVEAARADRLSWVAYPKAGQLGTDLNRDSLWARLQGQGVRPVRQVALDDVWSALRFRPE